MQALQAVTVELAHFVFIECFGCRTTAVRPSEFTINNKLPLIPREPVKGLESRVRQPVRGSTVVTEAISGEKLFTAVIGCPIFTSPVETFDGVITKLPYGAVLTYHRSQNRWSEVSYGDVRGWVLRDSVTDSSVTPQFFSDEYYGPEAKEVKIVRTIIADDFNGAALDLPLQDVEYVTYRLQKKARTLPWGIERPRTAGSWQRLLRGKSGVHIGVTPKTDSIMEVVHEDDTGHVAYVEAVFPDQSILISEVGQPEPGVFSAHTMTKEEWRELRPIFIEMS